MKTVTKSLDELCVNTIRMLAVPEILSFYFSRIFPIQRTVLRAARPVAQAQAKL